MAVRRGPRRERPPAAEAPARSTRPHDDGHGYTILLVPREGHGDVKQVSFSLRSLRRALVGVGLVGGLLLALGLVGLYSVFSVRAHDELIDENLFLRSRLEDVESKLTRVDQAIRRVMLYDSELRSAIGEKPASGSTTGPINPEELAPIEPEQPAPEGGPPAGEPEPGEAEPGADERGPTGSLEFSGEDPGEVLVDGGEYEDERTASAWADAISARADEMLRRLSILEPRLSRLAEDVQDFMSVATAMPTLWPVEGGVLTSPYGYRKGPITRRRKFHSGVDIGAPRGTQVFAAAAGTVRTAAWHSGYGRMILIDHGYGLTTLYGHNTSVYVREGEQVEAGAVIATVGSTGQSTGPHLHFEVWQDGEAVDPMDYLTP